MSDAEVPLWGYCCSALATSLVKGGLQLNDALWFQRLMEQRNQINSGWSQALVMCRLVERKSLAVVSLYPMEGTDLHGWIAQLSCFCKIGLTSIRFFGKWFEFNICSIGCVLEWWHVEVVGLQVVKLCTVRALPKGSPVVLWHEQLSIWQILMLFLLAARITDMPWVVASERRFRKHQ